MIKIAFIGAGSSVFGKRLIMDILSFPALQECTFTLMDIDQNRLDLMSRLAQKIIDDNEMGQAQVETTSDRLRALDGADYVVCSYRVGGFQKRMWSNMNAFRYGIRGSMGAGAATPLTNLKVLLDMCGEMERVCPNALLLMYTNPVATGAVVVDRYHPEVRYVGLCHSVQGTSKSIARWVGVPYDELEYLAAGINHMAWFLQLSHKGQDLYPRFWEAIQDPYIYAQESVRFDVARYFGYMVTEESISTCDQLPYFDHDVHTKAQYEICSLYGPNREYARQEALEQTVLDPLQGEGKLIIDRSDEYGSRILNAIETNAPFRFNGNVANHGYIDNLPEGCSVEVPCEVDGKGIHPVPVGKLPPQCAALNMEHAIREDLLVRATFEPDREALYYASQLSWKLSKYLSLPEIRAITDAELQAAAPFVPAEDRVF
jgi:alpha-galactosidase